MDSRILRPCKLLGLGKNPNIYSSDMYLYEEVELSVWPVIYLTKEGLKNILRYNFMVIWRALTCYGCTDRKGAENGKGKITEW